MPYLVEKSTTMAPFWESLNKGELKTTRCKSCHALHFPPTPQLCRNCFGFDMEWVNLPLTGTVETYTKVTAPPAGFTGEYYLASVIVDELEKPILGRYIGEDININDRVQLGFEKIGDQAVVIFKK